MNLIKTGLLLCAASLTTTTAVRAVDYYSTVTNLHPVGYYRLNENTTNNSNLAINSGTAGRKGDGFYIGDTTVMHPSTGLLVGSTDAGASFNGSEYVQVPVNAANNPQGPFTAECWVQAKEGLADNLYAVMTSGHLESAPARSGWLLYYDSTGNNSGGQVFDFRMYTHVGLNRSLTINGGGAPVAGAIYHVVVGYDGTNGFMYVNGTLISKAPSPGYTPNVDGNFTFGTRNDLAFTFSGNIDEVALYTNILSASDITAHYANGSSASPAVDYGSLVLAQHPLLYYRLDEPAFSASAPLPTSKNEGSWGATQDAILYSQVTAAVPGIPYGGFPAGNKSAYLNGLNETTLNGGYDNAIGIPNPPLNSADPSGTSNVTFTAWIKRNGPIDNNQGHYNGGFAGIVFERGTATSGTSFPATGLCYGANATGTPGNELRYHWNNGQYGFASGLIVPDGIWSFVAGVFTPTNTILDLNGTLVTNNVANVGLDFSIDTLFIGMDSTGGRVIDGSVDEVAIFDYALTPTQLATLYAAGGMPATITTQPSPTTQTFYEGQSTSYSVAAIGTPTIAYQWLKNGVAISGKTTTSLSFPNLHVADTANYAVKLTNPAGSVTSSVVTLTVLGGPPIITVVPASIARYPDGNATFKVAAVGSTPLSYQWKFGSTVIPGATNTSYTVSQIQPGDLGSYSVVVTNPNGSTNSPAAVLSSVSLTPTLVPAILTRAPYAYWRMNETNGSVIFDSIGSANGTFSQLTTKPTAGPVPPTFAGLDSTNTGYLFDGNTSDISCATPTMTVSNFTITAFVKPLGLLNSSQNGYAGLVFTRGTGIGGLGISPQGSAVPGTLGYVWNNNAYYDSGILLTSNVWNFVALVIDTVNNVANLYVDSGDGNGLQIANNNPSANNGTFPNMVLDSVFHLGTDPSGNKIFGGGIDEVALFASALSQTDIQAIHDAAYLNSYTPNPPAVTLDPIGGTFAGADTVTLSAGAVGSPPLAFQWYKNGVAVPGAIRASLTFPSLLATDSGTYKWVVTQGSTSVTSAPAVLSVSTIIITGQPTPASLLAGDSWNLITTARGVPPLTYQWLKDGNTVPGATSNVLSLVNVTTADAGVYACAVTSGSTTVTSANAAVAVVPLAPYVNLTNKLVLHLRFDTNSYADSSGRGNDAGVATGLAGGVPPFVTSGRVGGAVHIDNNNFLQVSDANGDLTFDTMDNFSVSLWVRYSAGFGDLPIIGNAVNSTFQLGWVITEDAGRFEWSLVSTGNSGAGVSDPVGGPLINDNQWHNLVAVFDRTNAIGYSYVDGKFASTHTLAAITTLITGQTITIGQDPTGAYGVAGSFDLDDVGIWRTALDRASSELIYYAGAAGRSFDTVGPAAPPSVTMTIAIVGNNLVIHWSQGTLQSSTHADSGYTNVVGATAPNYTIPLTSTGARFFRVLVQ